MILNNCRGILPLFFFSVTALAQQNTDTIPSMWQTDSLETKFENVIVHSKNAVICHLPGSASRIMTAEIKNLQVLSANEVFRKVAGVHVVDEEGAGMRINIGIGPNRFLAKQAAGWHKPDGLDVIDHRNLKKYYAEMELMDLNGIAERYSARLISFGISTPTQFLNTPEFKLKKQDCLLVARIVLFPMLKNSNWFPI